MKTLRTFGQEEEFIFIGYLTSCLLYWSYSPDLRGDAIKNNVGYKQQVYRKTLHFSNGSDCTHSHSLTMQFFSGTFWYSGGKVKPWLKRVGHIKPIFAQFAKNILLILDFVFMVVTVVVYFAPNFLLHDLFCSCLRLSEINFNYELNIAGAGSGG